MPAEDDQLATGGQADMSSAGACSKTKTNWYEERAKGVAVFKSNSGQTEQQCFIQQTVYCTRFGKKLSAVAANFVIPISHTMLAIHECPAFSN